MERRYVIGALSVAALGMIFAGCYALCPPSAPLAVGLLVWADLHIIPVLRPR